MVEARASERDGVSDAYGSYQEYSHPSVSVGLLGAD